MGLAILIFMQSIALLDAGESIECTAVTDNVVFPTFHVMNNITRVNGVLKREPLNDANASSCTTGVHCRVPGLVQA